MSGPRCLVCGHYHGGHGGCITAHAFIRPSDCPTCVAKHGAVGDGETDDTAAITRALQEADALQGRSLPGCICETILIDGDPVLVGPLAGPGEEVRLCPVHHAHLQGGGAALDP